MRQMPILYALPLLTLAACHADVDLSDANSNSSGDVLVAMKEGSSGTNKVSVNVPGFSANVDLPNIDLGSHMDLDGIKIAPHTKVGSFDVTARDNAGSEDDGNVRLSFTNSDAPAAIIDHYARSAAGAGYGDIVRSNAALTAHKGDKTFALQIVPTASGSQGTITIGGKG